MAMISIPGVHIGNNIRIIRDILGMKQITFAEQMGLTQATISKMEQSVSIEEERLEQVSEVLGISPEIIKNFNRDAVIYNYFQEKNQTMINNNYNPVDKIIELYDLLLKQEKEKVELLKERIHILEKQLAQ
ncbi:MAG TPA: helix-turn-helix transcriptional regulator [Candidatus Babeliaceae bacterium]|nr:helix-turn-helix transcriptional regulator [Candidatus Babeliaceae bacterium]